MFCGTFLQKVNNAYEAVILKRNVLISEQHWIDLILTVGIFYIVNNFLDLFSRKTDQILANIYPKDLLNIEKGHMRTW